MLKLLKADCMQFLLLASFFSVGSTWAQTPANSTKPLASDSLMNAAAAPKSLENKAHQEELITPKAKEAREARDSSAFVPDTYVPPKSSGYVAKNEGIQYLFNALSSEARKPFILSRLAQKKSITGDFDLSNPFRFLEKFANQIGLAWYDDGQTVYVYDNSELKNSVVIMRHSSLNSLNEFLQRTGLFSKRYPIRGEQKTGAFYVAGPPVYVDLVVNAAQYLDDLYKNVDLNKQKISIIKLQHTFVGDRTFKIRNQDVKISGIGNVIEAILANEFKELVSVTEQPSAKVVIEKDVSSLLSGKGAPAASPLEKSMMNQKSQIKVITYLETNSLLVKGTQEQVDLIEKLISQLDVPKRHIELSLWIIDITKDALDQFGINWQGALGIGNRATVTFNGAPAAGSTVSSAINGTRFLAAITALNNKGVAQVVSRPVILTQDNVPAIFDNNSTFYKSLTSERVASLEQVTYGTLINVLPRFSTSGDEIEMMLDIEDGQQATPGNGTNSVVSDMPVITRVKISTVARVPKDKSLLVGGFTIDNYKNNNSKIPFLGDLPLVGSLFQNRSESNTKVVRVYLIQPKLLDFGTTWDTQKFSEPSMLTPEQPLQESVKMLREYPGAFHGNN